MGTSPSNEHVLALSVYEVLRRWPELYSVFVAEGMGACLGCPIAPFESVAEASSVCHVGRERIGAALCAAIGAPGL